MSSVTTYPGPFCYPGAGTYPQNSSNLAVIIHPKRDIHIQISVGNDRWAVTSITASNGRLV